MITCLIFITVSLYDIILWNYFQLVTQYEFYEGVFTENTQYFNAVIHKTCRRQEKFRVLLSTIAQKKKKWQAYLRTCTKAANLHKSLQLVKFCLNMLPHNAANQVLSLWNNQQTIERHRLSAETTKDILTLRFNSKNVSCNQLHTYTCDIPAILKKISSTKKHAGR